VRFGVSFHDCSFDNGFYCSAVSPGGGTAVPFTFLPRVLAGLLIMGEASEFIKTFWKKSFPIGSLA
jgi:hypothetical protein